MPVEQGRNALNDSRGIDAAMCQNYRLQEGFERLYSRLTLEVLHYIEKPIVDIGLLNEADLDLVEITERVLRKGSHGQFSRV
jgi:hypothetical protein